MGDEGREQDSSHPDNLQNNQLRGLDLPSRYLPCRSDREFEHLAKCAQICIPWSNVIRFPKIDARGADADLFSNFGNR